MIPEQSQSAPGAGATPSSPAGFSASQGDTTLSETLVVLRKRRWALIAAVLLGALFGMYKAVTQVRLYVAAGRIQIREGSSNEFKLSPTFDFSEDDPQRKAQTEIAIITSDTLLATVGREMNLANNPEFLGAKGPIRHQSMDDPAVRQEVVDDLQNGVRVSMVPKTDIIRISFSSLNPKLSADIVNHIVQDYIQRSYETRYTSTQQVSHFLQGQLEELKHEVEASQDRVLELQEKLGTLGFGSKNSEATTSLDDLARASGAAKLARIVAESRYRMLTGMDPSTIESSIDAGPNSQAVGLNSLRQSLALAKASLAELTATLGPNHPQVKTAKANVDALQHEVDAEQSRLLTQAKENFLIAKANEDQTAAALETEKQAAYKLGGLQVQYTIALRQFESDRTLYDGLMQKLRTAGVEAGLESLEIDVVDAALPPMEPQLRPKSTIVLLYVFLGLILGGVLAVILEALDTGMSNVAEIESVTELPSLAIIPRARRATPEQIAAMSTVERNINVLTQPKSQFTEAFRSLRTALLLSTAGHEPKYILFTSATPSEGKTTATSNLAVILSQRGTRTLLIDADLRRPNVHHRFGLNGKLGLSTILSGQTTLEDSVQRVPEVPGLDILASGPVPPFPTEMLSSQTMRDLLTYAGTIYTHIVIDSPPILSVTDGVILSREVDAVVLVVRHGKSSKHVVRRARDLLVRSSAPLAGVVLNAVDLNSPEYYGYYGYSGYSYSSLDAAGWDAKGESGTGEGGKGRKKGDR
jgi:succinoglycan biosynthesis transport protein ExoP